MTKGKRSLWMIRGLLTALLLAAMLAVWPGYAVYKVYGSGTNSYGCLLTEPLEGNAAFAQYFIPQKRWLSCIELALQFQKENIQGETVKFEVYDGRDECIFGTGLRLEEMPVGGYFSVEIDKKVRVGELYYWRIVAPEAQEAQLSVMYTDTQEYQAPENQYITLGEERYGSETSQSVSQYVYKVHPDKAVVIGKYWIFFVLIWILCMEAADRVIAGRVS